VVGTLATAAAHVGADRALVSRFVKGHGRPHWLTVRTDLRGPAIAASRDRRVRLA
jgi:hypothetical protein